MRRRVLETLSDTFWVLVLSVVCLFAFFVALGALAPAEVAGLTLGVVALAALWIGHAMWDARRRTGRDVAAIRARERRGF
jgi:membrane protein implicated in regulation of membrane protease activity